MGVGWGAGLGTYPWADWKGWAVITRGLSPDPGMGEEEARAVSVLTERTVWNTRLWEVLGSGVRVH